MARILIVDDDWLQRLAIAGKLTDLGYEVAGQAETGADAISMARELKPDLILMDVMMPGGMNGIEAAMKIKGESDIPIVFISGFGDPELIEKAKMIEPFGYVMKPFDESEIQAFVEIALYKSNIERKMAQANRQLNDMNRSLQQEIKNRKRVEETLSHSQRIAKLGSWELDLNTEIITLSKEYQFMAGKEPSEISLPLAEFAASYVVEEDVPIIQKRLAIDIENIENTRFRDKFEYRLKTDDVRGYKNLSVEVRFKSKGVMHGVTQDISERKQAEKALRYSEEKYRELVENLNDVIYSINVNGKITYVSPPVESILGYTPAELTGKHFTHLIHPEDMEKIKRAFVDILEGRYSPNEYRMRTKNGQYRWLRSSSLPVRDDGQIIGLQGVITDITDHKLTEEALRESERNYRKIFNNSSDAIFVHDAETGAIVDANKTACDVFGYTLGEIRTLYVGDLSVNAEPYTNEQSRQLMKKVLEQGPQYFEWLAKAKDDKLIWFENSMLHVNLGGKDRILVFGRNINVRKLTEEALRSSEEKYRTILETIGDGYFEVDMVGNIMFFNDSFCRIAGFSKDELMGTNYKKHTDKKAVKRISQVFNNIYVTGKPIKGFQYSFTRKDGSQAHLEVAISLIKNSEGLETGFRGVTRDITEKTAAEEERLMLEGQLHQAQKMAALGTLVAGVAHEINNPNNFITINAPMVNKAWVSIIPVLEAYYDHNGDFSVGGLPYSTMRERMPQLLKGISDGAGRIKKIVSDLKRFARSDPSLSFEPVDINSAVKSSLTLVSNLIKKSTNHFKVEYGRNIPKINGNHQHLEQVFINLLQNACLSLPDKNKEICVSTTYREKDQTILIKFRDQGVGIPADSLSRIMDPFFTTRRNSGGTGLGLSVSFSMIEKHSGTLSVASEEGAGSTFTVALPTQGKKDRVRVLVVDDDDMFRETIVAALEQSFRFSIEEAATGMDACIKLGSFKPDLLILDIRMPDMSGVEVCKRIKADPDFGHMEVIIITGFPGGDEAGKIAGMGFNKFCPKPVKLKVFKTIVQEALAKEI